ncbi:MAG: DUF1015 family protein [Candidatus Omnitrophica bacterium]|nr:DUF1015 family protein [Candidatus Omnitrophota bacterium]
MAEVIPFKGVIYDSDKAGEELSRLVAPPYDVISEEEREELYDRSDYNIIRLILGRDRDGDGSGINKYTRAGALLREWMGRGIMVEDSKPAFYTYEQKYTFKGKPFTRTGFLGLMKIGEPENDDVVPHEHTLSKPKEDRLNLIKEVKCNLSPIFTLFNDDKGEVASVLDASKGAEPLLDIKTRGEEHRMWRITRPEDINKIVSSLRGKKVFIADGHHRYEVSRSYRDLRRKEPGYDGSADYVMMYFADMSSPDNLTVMATHRVVKQMPVSSDEALEKISGYFEIIEESGLNPLMARLESAGPGKHAIGYYDGNRYVFFAPGNEEKVRSLIGGERSAEWKELDVSVLHSAVLQSLLGMKPSEGNITYYRDAEDAVAAVDKGEGTAAFLMAPTPVEQLKAVAEQGEMMPQKSTYFYPKLLTGLVINRIQCYSEFSNAVS